MNHETATLRILVGLGAIALAATGAGCARYTALREGRYAETSPETIHRAGTTGDPELADALARLLRTRASHAAEVGDDQAVEAVLSLARLGARAHAGLVADALRRDPSPEVRWFAVEALAALDAARLRELAPEMLEREPDALVRDRVRAVLATGGGEAP